MSEELDSSYKLDPGYRDSISEAEAKEALNPTQKVPKKYKEIPDEFLVNKGNSIEILHPPDLEGNDSEKN